MITNLCLPGDDLLDQTLAEFMGYFWCRYYGGQVVGERIVRFLMSPEQFEEAKTKFGSGSIGVASGAEQVEQLAYRALPAYHSDLSAMAQVEAKIYSLRMGSIYTAHLRDAMGLPVVGSLTADDQCLLITASARIRSRAAFTLIEAQKPRAS